MPSCSSKLSLLRVNSNIFILKTCDCYYQTVSCLLVYSNLSSCLCQVNKTVNEVARCCVKTNYFIIYCNHLKIFQVPKIYIIKKLISSELIYLSKCIVQRDTSIHGSCSLSAPKLFNHNVILLLVVLYLLLSSLCCVILGHSNVQRQTLLIKLLRISFKSYGSNFKSVMEVEETIKEVDLLVKNLPRSEEEGYFRSIKSDEIYTTVINDVEIIGKASFSSINSNLLHENSIGLKIKQELSSENKEMVANGDLIVNCLNDHEESECKKLVDIAESPQTDKEIIKSIKDRPNGGNNEIVAHSVKCEIKEEKTNDINDIQQTKVDEKTKDLSKKVLDVEDKSKEKNSNVNNSTVNCVPSSSSSSSSLKSKSHSSNSSSSHHRRKDSKDEKYKTSSASSSKIDHISSSRRRGDEKLKYESRSKSKSCHHKSDEKCHCKSHHRSHHRSKSKKYQSVKTQCSADEIAFDLNENKFQASNPFTRVPWVPHPQLADLKYGKFYRIEVDRNGGASVCHLYFDEISHLSEAQLKECAIEFVKLSYSEDENECAHHVMGIVHGAASYLPDLVDYMADHYPTLIVKTGSLASRDNHTTTMSQYRDEVYKTYSNGTFRYAPLDQLSICGVLGEEVGAYFPDFVARLEQSPFMKPVMPWSFLSVVQTDNPRESNDGPIFWVRPGEQMLPANEALKESARPKKRRNNELDNLAYIAGSRSSEARESLFMDRTKAHADQVGVDYGISNTAPTAAVGVLKAVNCGHPEHGNRATKDVVAFHAQDYNELLEILMLDLYEPPQTQCTKWIEVSKLNTLRREGIRYAHLQLHDNDVYYLPRKIIHQFQTISSVASVAWHIRYRDYFSVRGAPNLHTPTGINKGQVFYEKKNVAVYCPPVCENDLIAAVTNSESGLKTPKKVDRLKEYSPFKHSPRKMHKHQTPRSASKKQPESESTPFELDSNVKVEPTINTFTQESKGSSSTKKCERSTSDDGRTFSEVNVVTKKDHDDESRKSEKSVTCHSRRISSEHTSSKKEKKTQDCHSNHRKEVKNLESAFKKKKDRLSLEKSSSNHEKRKSGESKHISSSRRKERHEESSKSKSSIRNKHEKSKEDEERSCKLKTEANTDKEESGLKRKLEEPPNHWQAKKVKDENVESLSLENSTQGSKQEAESFCENRVTLNHQDVNSELAEKKAVSEWEQPIGGKDRQEKFRNIETEETEKKLECEHVHNILTMIEKEDAEKNVNPSEENEGPCKSSDFDLGHNVPSYLCFINQIPPYPPPPPPPPPTSPPVDPPPPPPPPFSPVPSSSGESSQSSKLLDNCVPLKEKGDNHVKKVKKKLLKKETESYDLLGDIMSKMDKKK